MVKTQNKLWPKTGDAHIRELKEYFDGTSIDIIDAYVLIDEVSQVCGFMELNIRNFSEGSRSPKVPYVEAWFVDSMYRGNGYGKQLISLAESWAKEKGYDELASDTEIENKESIKIHKWLDFQETERIVCFLKKL